VLHHFKGGTDGLTPLGSVIFDASGNLYETTVWGGGSSTCNSGCGTVFELVPNTNGSWSENVLYRFTGGADGSEPAAGVIFDEAGNLYGTTNQGGDFNSGTVFKLSRNTNGSWTESVLHSFNGTDGNLPNAALTFDVTGNLYSTTSEGGTNNCGVVFKLTPNGDGSWTESVIYELDFKACAPLDSLVFDASGNLYGTASSGGIGKNAGAIFELTPNTNGNWTETVLHTSTTGGHQPLAGVTFDASGNLYGTNSEGHPGNGTIYELTHNPDGTWSARTLHRLENPKAGAYPIAGVILDSSGNLYGAAYMGGAYGYGTVFKLTPNSKGAWPETVLHAFRNTSGGGGPHSNLILDRAGNLYGTTTGDLFNTFGAVFEITP
jgi:uncharacterized repeat protein (TIGR03803 family)